MMKIERVVIDNYRSIKHLEFQMPKFMALVGYNNAGKSNVLSAVQWAIEGGKLSVKDFNDASKPVSVALEISGYDEGVVRLLTDSSKRTKLINCLQDGILRFRQRMEGPSASSVQPQVLRKQNDLNSSDENWEKSPFGMSAGLTNILPQVIRINAMEDAVEISSKNKRGTAFSELLQSLFSEDVKKEVERRLEPVGAYFEESSVLSDLSRRVTKELSSFYPGASIDFQFSAIPAIDVLSYTQPLLRDSLTSEARSVEQFGQGIQRSLQMAMLSYLSEKHDNSSNPRSTILMIDEPELYQHPRMIEVIRDSLIDLSEKESYQILLTTHSPVVMKSKTTLEGVRIVRKNDFLGTVFLSKATDLSVADSVFRTYKDLENLSFAPFSEVILLVEGETENKIISKAFRDIYPDLYRRMCIIRCGSCSAISRMASFLKQLGLNVRALVDLDAVKRWRDFLNETELEEDRGKVERLVEGMHSFFKMNCSNTENGWPTKKSGGDVITHFAEWGQLHPGEVDELFEIFKEKTQTWIWKCGAIEEVAFPGLKKSKKNEAALTFLGGPF